MRKTLLISLVLATAIVSTGAVILRVPKLDDGAMLKYATSRAMHKPEWRVYRGELLGILQIPRLGLAVPVLEGSDGDPLEHGAGHIPYTAFPGHHGNAGIAAHRDTCFRALRFIRPNDDIVITTPAGSYDYVVSGTEIVGPDEGRVLARTPTKNLTLVTCFPFFYSGDAPQRFIVHASAYTPSGCKAGDPTCGPG